MEVKLVVTNGQQAGKEIHVKSPKFVIGRHEDCQLRPQSHLISRRHCAILVEGALAIVEDLGSTNGTFINDERLSGRRELKTGDRIKVGSLELEVHLPVALGGKSKPKVQSVQEAAIRTAAVAAAGEEDFDVSSWLGEENDFGPASTPAKKLPTADETVAGTGLTETIMIPPAPAPAKKAEEKKKAVPSKTPGKFNRPAKPTTDSSGAAADDALRQFFHRKKT